MKTDKSEREQSPELGFLDGAGEMATLTRNKDWSKTSLGAFEMWPQSLRTTLSIILNSRFPMFLWWGPELISFYNDAYRPSLGENGKHPQILGMSAKDAWPEIWSVIEPMIDQVLAGGPAVWNEDQLIPIFRNGKIEDVYWTFSYSPVRNEEGKINGVLVTCTETTEKVRLLAETETRENQLNFTINAADLGTWDLNPVSNKFSGNRRLCDWFGLPYAAEIDLPSALATILPEDRQKVIEAIQKATSPGSDGQYNIAYTIVNAKDQRVRKVIAKGRAVFDRNGLAIRFSGTLQDITDQVSAAERLYEEEKKFRDTVHQAPIGITILRGSDFRVEMANERYLELVDKEEKDFVGKPIMQSLPEVQEIVEPLLQGVLNSGIAFRATDFPVTLKRFGKNELAYFDLIYHPLHEKDGTTSGIMVVANEVTESVKSRHALAESEKQFRNMVMNSPIPMTILRGDNFIIETANDVMFDAIWRKQPTDVLGRSILEVFPELKDQKYEQLLNTVLTSGVSYTERESVAYVQGDDGLKKFYLDFEYAPLLDVDTLTSGIMITVNDVSEKVEARLKVEESEKRFRSIADSAPVMIWMCDAAKTRYYFNTAWLSFTGHSINEEMNNGWAKGMHPEDVAKWMAVFEKSFTDRISFYHEYRLLDHAGVYRWVSDSGTPRFSADGIFEGYTGACMNIDEQVIYHKKLKEDEARLSIVVSASELGTWDLDLQTNKIVYSDHFLEIFGFDKTSSCTHADLVSRIHIDDMPARLKAFREAYRTGQLHYISRIIWEDNSIHWIETKGRLFYDEESKPSKLIGTIRDITEEKNYQEGLLEREQKFRLLADSMPQFIWTSGADGVLDYFSKAVFDYTGLSRDSLHNNLWVDIVHPEDREANISAWKHSVETGEDYLFEHRVLRKDGQYRWHVSSAIPQRNAAGEIQMWVGSSTDIEDQKLFTQNLEKQVNERTYELAELNRELIKSEERYHLMVNEVQEYAILYLSKDGIIENWNKGAEKIKGYEATEIVGQHFSVFYTDQDKANNLPFSLLQTASEKGKAAQEGMRVRKDGTLFWADVVITAIHNELGEVIGFSKVTHDLTERKKADESLRNSAYEMKEKNQELEKMNAELQSFAYISSHDLQEPLRKIQIFSARILESEFDKLSAKGKDYFTRMQSSANRMQTLIRDLLAYSRTNNNAERKFEVKDLNEIVEEVKNDLAELIAENKASIIVQDLCEVSMIHFQFVQLMHNLIGNALKFTRPGVPPLVSIQCEKIKGADTGIESLFPQKTYCHIILSDNGIGFENQYKDRIFEVFQRLHEKGEYTGTGIGLAIVKKIVENHSGLIIASSKPGNGAQFDIYIPYH